MYALDVVMAMSICLGMGFMANDATAARCAPEEFLAINSASPRLPHLAKAPGTTGTTGTTSTIGTIGTIGTASATAESARQIVLYEAQLLRLPDASITTGTQWSDKKNRYDGPLLSDVLQLADVRGESIRLFARNDYSVTIPWSDMARFGVILALSRDGQRMTARDFGPLFLMYPRDQFMSELDTPSGVGKFIWQVCRIDVQ